MRRLPMLALLLLPACAGPEWLSLDRLNPFATEAEEEEPRDDQPALRLTRSGRGSFARAVQEQGRQRIWRSRDGLVIATDGARVTGTAGLPSLLLAQRFDGGDPMANPRVLRGNPQDSRRVVDLSGPDRSPRSMRFGIVVQCRVTARMEPDEAGMTVTERCTSAAFRPFINWFYVDMGTDTITDSLQWVGPDTPPLRMAHPGPRSWVIRPPTSAAPSYAPGSE
jgi:hypothetical protein